MLKNGGRSSLKILRQRFSLKFRWRNFVETWTNELWHRSWIESGNGDKQPDENQVVMGLSDQLAINLLARDGTLWNLDSIKPKYVAGTSEIGRHRS